MQRYCFFLIYANFSDFFSKKIWKPTPALPKGGRLVFASELRLYFAFVVGFSERLALVVGVFALAECDFHLGETSLVDEEAEGYDGLACVFGEFRQFAQLLVLKQEFAVALGFVVGITAEAVLCDVHLLDPQFVALELAVGVGEARFALADGLDFRPVEHDARRIAVENQVIETRPFVFYIYIAFETHKG